LYRVDEPCGVNQLFRAVSSALPLGLPFLSIEGEQARAIVMKTNPAARPRLESDRFAGFYPIATQITSAIF